MAISSSVSSFLSTIQQGVRPNLFLVNFDFPNASVTAGGSSLSFPSASDDLNLVDILCKSAALPASNLGVIEVPFRGRTVKIAGDRTFDTWTATFINDKNFKIRGFMERWMSAINAHEANTASYIVPNNSAGYTADLRVKQLERDATEGGTALREYLLKDCFPTNISQIDLAYDSNDQIEDFTVEFQIQYWTATSPSEGNSPSIG
jgi:hypothetical protein